MEDTEKQDQQTWGYDADLKRIFNDALICVMDTVASYSMQAAGGTYLSNLIIA